MATGKEVFEFLVHLGLVDVVLPFVLVFTIVYALLQRTKVLGSEKGEPKKKMNAMVAFVLGLFAVVSFQQFAVLQVIGQVSGVGIIIILAVLILAGMVGVKDPSKSKLLMGIGVVVVIVGFLIVLNTLGVLPENVSELATPLFGAPFVVAVVFFAIVWFIVRSPSKKEAAAPKKPVAGPGVPGAAKPPELEARAPVSPHPLSRLPDDDLFADHFNQFK